ncbi:cation diffusion facilitator transporter [Clostridia bacterium]|nr:cation diffusion facilitator transporter [Clostridia bacterium]
MDKRADFGKRTAVVGIVANAVLFGAKFLAGTVSGSFSVIADAFNNLSDLGNVVITLVGFKFSEKPADREHPFGHGRMEYVSGLAVSLAVMLVGVELLRAGFVKSFLSGAAEPPVLSALSVCVLVFSAAMKLGMYFYNRHVAKLINSPAVAANAADSISDVFVTLTVLACMVAGHFAHVNIDGYAGMAVALVVFKTGFSTARDCLTPLLGSKPDPAFVHEITGTVLSYDGIKGIHDLMVHNYGVGACVVSLHAEVPQEMGFAKAHELIDHIEDELNTKYRCHSSIHMDPLDSTAESAVLKDRVRKLVSAIDCELTIHDFRVVSGECEDILLFDVVIPFKFRLSGDEVHDKIALAVSVLGERYKVKINFDREYS